MAKYRIYGTVIGSKYLGEVEADSYEEALEEGWALDAAHVSVCHQCASEVDDPVINSIEAEKK